MKKKKFIDPFKPLKIKKPHFNLDSDRDGVVDFKDCQPFNYWKQDNITDEERKMIDKIQKVYKQIDAKRKEIQKQYPDEDIRDFGNTYNPQNPTNLDPLVKPVISEIYRKGFTTSQSCQGGPGHSIYPSISVENNKRLLLAFLRAGFTPTQYSPEPNYVSFEYQKEGLTKNQIKNIWKKALSEVKKI